jgi:prepilin-type N-terminal cleavage/methylation domain-containing protein
MRQPAITPRSDLFRRGFTIVELLIVIVVIGILAAITIVAYNGIKARADDASMQSEASQASKKILAYKATNSDTLPADTTTAGITAGSGHDLFYRVTPDGKNFCLAVNMSGDLTRAFSVASTNNASGTSTKKGTCQGYILVPANLALGTANDFWVMKYEAKNVSGIAISQAATTPWATISQTDAIARSQQACDGCHLMSEAERMTLVANVLAVSSNWTGGAVGVGLMLRGNLNTTDAASCGSGVALDGSTSGTNCLVSSRNKRMLTLSNGEEAWDLAGNVWEWSPLTFPGNQQPGIPAEPNYSWKDWSHGSMQWGAFPASSRPSAISPTVAAWTMSQGVGSLFSYLSSTDPATHAIVRGGSYIEGANGGVLAVTTDPTLTDNSSLTGFRVAR